MRYGPLTGNDINRLKDMLDKHAAVYNVEVSAEHLEVAKEADRDRIPTQHPSYKGPQAYYFIDIEKKDLLIVRRELEKMGVFVRGAGADPLPDLPEYLCLSCDYMSHEPGECPRHRRALLEFSDWSAAKRAARERATKSAIIILLLMFGAIYLYTHIL